MNKKGVSNIIVILISIVLVLVAIDMVWFVVKKNIGYSKDISIEGLLIDLEVINVVDNGDSITVKVKRNTGGGKITGLKFAISDGVETLILNKKNLDFKELEEKEFTLTFRSIVKEVSVAPYFITEAGSEKLGNQIRKIEYSDKEAMENTDSLMSWWRMDGNANDSIGNNHGIPYGGVNFIEDNKRGKVADFDGIDGNITIPNPSENLSNDLSILFWVNPKSDNKDLIYKDDYGEFAFKDQLDYINYYQGNLTNKNDLGFGISPIINNKWNHLALTRSTLFTTLKKYVNGDLKGSQIYLDFTPIRDVHPVQSNNPIIIGDGQGNTFKGLIDEIMIFNKTLSNEEVTAIANLELKV